MCRLSLLGRTLSGFIALLLILLAQPALVHAQIEQNTVERYLQENRAAGNKPNKLIQQSSPYLLQHAYNPVHWYAWGEQAFELARKQNKPILLSIGYSTCYWCHVMAHESFENEKIASVLNKHFISIKVDREERPDIDDVYMAATELVNGYGGWPMTVFLNHDLEPFHAGVYYPPFSTDSSTGFYELLLKVSELWNKDRARIDMVAEQIASHIKAQADEVVAGASIDRDVLSEGFDQIADSYDEDYAGFGDAPKFPQPGIYAFLLSIAEGKTENASSALKMLRQTLLAMSQGGLYDQIGGGFHRYSVDARWQVPHFEKMLYTQALMALAYTRLYEIQPDARYLEVVTGTLRFVLDEMRHPQGAFYSALDASSERPDQPGEHSEGAYYLWRAADLRSVLNKDEWEFIRRYFDIQDNGNIVSDPRGEFEKLNILYISEDYRQKKIGKAERTVLDSAKRRLGQQRLKRPRPHLDDKILVAWNGMMIRALVEAARVFKDQKYLDAAVAAAEFVQGHFIESQTDVLYRRMRNDEVGIQANLVDYVWYVNGLLALYRQTGEKHWLQRARKLTNKQVQLFHDVQSGGFYESAAEKHVLFRSRSAYDGALPAPNAIAIENLYLLAGLTEDGKWRKMADKALASFAASINNNPVSAGWMLSLIGREQLTVKSEK